MLKRPFAWKLAVFFRTDFSTPVEGFIALLIDLEWLKRPPSAIALPGNCTLGMWILPCPLVVSFVLELRNDTL